MKKIILFFFMYWQVQILAGQSSFNITREQVMIPLRDGVKLSAILYRPATPGRYPALVLRTPYDASKDDANLDFNRKAAKNGYVVFLVDVRGRYGSEGSFEAYRFEKEDGYDVIEWVGKSPYCNGKVGTYGISYRGYVQWLAMSQRPTHLAAAAPANTPITSHDFFYSGGAFSTAWLDWFMPSIFADKRRRANDSSGPWDSAVAREEWNNEDKWRWYSYRPLYDLPLLKEYGPEYYEWMKHPEKSTWWDFASVEDDFGKIDVPAFLISGWYDASYGPEGATKGFNKMRTEAGSEIARKNTRLILGPWNHTWPTMRETTFGEVDFGPSAGLDYDAELLSWFDTQLKGSNNYTKAPVSIFIMGENVWRDEQEWPLSRAVQTDFYLHSNGKASIDKSAGLLNSKKPMTDGSDSYVFDPTNPFWDISYLNSYPYDQKDNENRKDVLVYTSAPLADDQEVTGEIVAELFVSSKGKDTDFSISICDVYPDGRSINVAGLDAGYLRMRYRNGLEKQELMKPDEVYQIRIDKIYTSNVFKKGHRIRLQITSSKAPHYDPNPNTGTEIATEAKLISVVNTIHHSKKYPSKIILPVIP